MENKTSQGSGEMINPPVMDQLQETMKRKLEDMVTNVPVMPSNNILGNIVERKFDEKYRFDSSHVFTAEHEFGFPKVFKLNDVELTKKNTSKKQSLFRQHVSTRKSVRDDSAKIQQDESLHHNKEETIEDRLALEIHQENLEKLAKMSEAEILKEKMTLESTLDPKIIEFLKNKKKCGIKLVKKSMQDTASASGTKAFIGKKLKFSSNGTKIENKTSSVSIAKETAEIFNDKETNFPLNEDNVNMDCEDDSIPKSPKEILKEGQQKGWLHMNTPEPEKLKWMEDLKEEKKDEPEINEEYNARFDFNG